MLRFVLLALVLLSAGCGQKGDLYFPAPTPSSPTPSADTTD